MSPRIWRPAPLCSHTEGHTADIWIVGEGRDLAAILDSMLQSMYLVIAEEFALGRGGAREFAIEGASSEEALVRFLAEALYLLEGEGVIMIGPSLEVKDHGEGLSIRVRGKAYPFSISDGRSGIEVKAITYHGSLLERRPDGSCLARVLIDI